MISAAESRTVRRCGGGHGQKIAMAIAALQKRGALPPALRPVELYRRVTEELHGLGFRADEMPSRSALARYLASAQTGADAR